MINNARYKPDQQYLFNRAYSIALSPSGQATAVEYTKLRIKFDIDKLGLGTSAKCKIDIYNLSQESRGKIGKGWNIRLKAGYQNLLATIFLGVIGPNGAYSKRDQGDIITTFECGDGESALVLGTLDKSYPSGTTLSSVLQDVIVASGLGQGAFLGVPATTFSKGFMVHGSITTTLNILTKKAGLSWSVNNGNINIIPIKGTDGQQAEVVSKATGLIGVPSIDNGVLKFNSLLNPRLVPGALVQLISDNTFMNGFYRVNRAHLEGDSHDSKWGVACEAIKMPSGTVALR